ncbi:MAG: PEP-CTERM sorting domain-containing protein, partial [Deltaproteobacteria bacterium]
MSSCLRALRLLSGLVLLLALASPSPASAVTILASDSGWHSSAGVHTASNQDYEAGWSGTTDTFHNFFVFDLSSLTLGQTILSATLRVYNPQAGEPNANFGPGFSSPDATETYNLHEVLAPAAVVTAPSLVSTAVYTDLGDVALNAAGLAAAQTWVGIGSFVLGGEISTLNSASGIEEFVFGHTDPPGFGPYTRELVLVLTPEPGTGALVATGLVGLAARRRRFRREVTGVLGVAVLVGLVAAAAPGAASAVTEIKVLSNRADLISGGDALLEVVPVPPPGTVVLAGATNVTGSFAVRANGRYMGLVTGLAVGNNLLKVTLPDSSGASIAIANHPIEGPVFSGPHLQPWDCTSAAQGVGEPIDANCNVVPVIEYLYVPSSGGGYVAYDVNQPPSDVSTITNDQGHTVRNIIRRESGAINRGLYAFAVLHDPALDDPPGAIAPWNPQSGWNGKMYYPFGASCNTNQTQGSSKTDLVTDQTRLEQGFLVATTSLNELGHHCNPILSAEAALMTKEHIIETVGPIRFTISTGGSGGSIGQHQVSNAYPGITNGLIPSLTFPDVWSTAIEVADCFLTETYWPKAAVPFTILQKSAVDGHGPTQSSCNAWVALFVPSGIPTHGCFSGSTLPTTSTPDPQRDYNPVTNPDGCRATVNDIQVNIWGRRPQDDFAKRPIDNAGVQYGLAALNLPLGNPGKITFAQFLDMNLKVGGVDIDGVPQTARTRTDVDVSRIAYR